MNWKLPPREKIYEAFSVLADNRYKMIDEGKAVVTSSAGDKKYTVTWLESGNAIKTYSDDNASRWQGYTGYPIIALLMINGKINFNRKILTHFRNIPWNDLNKSHKNNYAEAVNEILSGLETVDVQEIRTEVENIYNQIGQLHLIR